MISWGAIPSGLGDIAVKTVKEMVAGVTPNPNIAALIAANAATQGIEGVKIATAGATQSIPSKTGGSPEVTA